MLTAAKPRDAYARIGLDAYIAGADSRQLVGLCLESVADTIGVALEAAARGNQALKSQSLTKALAALTALQLGVDKASAMGSTLDRYYGAARRTVIDSAVNFDAEALAAIRADFREISEAMAAA